MHTDDAPLLSEPAAAELGQDHLCHGSPDDDGSVAILAFAEPASLATPLGAAVVEQAETFLKLPLREDAGVNTDSHHYIRTFFLEGLTWPANTWDHWTDRYPQSVVAKPEWCAAFASYCVRKAYEAAGQALPVRLSGATKELEMRFEAAGRLLRREKLYGQDGAIPPQVAVVPGPGDLALFQGHVGILRELYNDGTFTTIEGNTYKGSPRHDGVYQCNRSAGETRADGTLKLVGFCLLTSQDGVTQSRSPASPAAQTTAAAPPAQAVKQAQAIPDTADSPTHQS